MIGTAAAIVAGVAAASSAAGGIVNAVAAGKQGAAQESAAQTQVQFEREALDQQIKARADTLSKATSAAAMSPEEVKSINSILSTRGQALTAAQQAIQKQQEQLDQIDPTVKAAGKNLLQLLQGKAADTLAPMQTQLARQRAQLVSNLSSQLGPGYATSSAGIEALTRFDQQSSLAVSQAQQQALSTVASTYGGLFGAQQGGQNTITNQISNAFAQAQNATASVLGAEQNIANRQVGAVIGATNATPVNFAGPAQAQQSVINTAGNSNAGLAGVGGALSGLGAGVGQVSGQIASASMFKDGLSGGTNPFASSNVSQNFTTGNIFSQGQGPGLFKNG